MLPKAHRLGFVSSYLIIGVFLLKTVVRSDKNDPFHRTWSEMLVAVNLPDDDGLTMKRIFYKVKMA